MLTGWSIDYITYDTTYDTCLTLLFLHAQSNGLKCYYNTKDTTGIESDVEAMLSLFDK